MKLSAILSSSASSNNKDKTAQDHEILNIDNIIEIVEDRLENENNNEEEEEEEETNEEDLYQQQGAGVEEGEKSNGHITATNKRNRPKDTENIILSSWLRSFHSTASTASVE